MPQDSTQTRRTFLVDGSLVLLAAASTPALTGAGRAEPEAAQGHQAGRALPGLRIGVVADVHYADADARGARHYRDSIGKVRDAVETFNTRGVDLVVELGDLVDNAPGKDAARELEYLRVIAAELAAARAPRHYVLGNHCVSSWSKARFLAEVGQHAAHYSFEARGVHVVVLDACYRADGVPYDSDNFDWTDTDVPAPEREWLAADLERAGATALVFVHHRLDLPVGDEYAIRSSPDVRAILERSGKVRAVVMGHSHRNDYREIGGISYITLAALVDGPGLDNGAHAIIALDSAGHLALEGFRKIAAHPFPGTRRR